MSFESILSSKRWRLSFLTYKINSESAEITSWTYRLSLHLLLLEEASLQSIARLLHHSSAKHQKFEFSTLYIQSYISDLEEVSSQLFACFIIFVILYCDIFQIKSRIKALTSLASYIQNRFRASKDYISIIASMIFDLNYLALACNHHSNTDISMTYQIN